jgi:hypothetical protein
MVPAPIECVRACASSSEIYGSCSSTCSLRRLPGSLTLILIPIVYCVVNLKFSGPIYIYDEIGYLANAAFFTGSEIDAASSYHAGYSILLMPAFLIFNDTWWIWKAIVATNALLFWIAFIVLYNISIRLDPDVPNARRIIYILICAAYPAYMTAAGYAFSQPGHVFFFVIAIWCLVRCCGDARSSGWAIAHGLACGFIFWIHPTGLMVVAASMATMALRGHRESKWFDLLGSAVVALLMIATYQLLVAPHIIRSMTPAGYLADLRYPSVGEVLAQLGSAASLIEMLLRSIGVVSYLTVASAGFALWGIVFAVRRSLALFGKRPLRVDSYIYLFCILALVGTVGITTAVNTPISPAVLGNDAFFYGRYSESVLLLILLAGIIHRSVDKFFYASILVVFWAFFLKLSPGATPVSELDVWRGLNFINVTGFWPIVLPREIPLWATFLVSAVIIAAVGLFSKPRALTTLIIAFAIGSLYALQWHNLDRSGFAPGSLPHLIETIWPPKTCIGRDPVIPSEFDTTVRYHLLEYYLHNYTYRRTTPTEWRTLCDGPVLTYRLEEFGSLDGKIIAKEKLSGIALITHAGTNIAVSGEFSDLYTQPDGVCLTRWCVKEEAADLQRFSQVGRVEGGAIWSIGKSGFLIFGPYVHLAAGTYSAEVSVRADDPAGAYFDAIDSRGERTLAKFALGDAVGAGGNGMMEAIGFTFTTPKSVDAFELRLFVTASTKVAVYGYTITRLPP